MSPADAPALASLYGELLCSPRIDGELLVAGACAEPDLARLLDQGPVAVLALGKAAPSMLRGVLPALGSRPLRALVIAPERSLAAAPLTLPPPSQVLVSDHPQPGERSLRAGAAALSFAASLQPGERLLVLLSGGGSALAVVPAAGVDFSDKRSATAAVAAAGANIHELNAVRKHLSALKGGQLALAAAGPVEVLVLSDVVGNDLGTIASGPFSADSTTFADALAVVDRLAPRVPPAVRQRLESGARGELPETPKPGDPRLAAVHSRILAGPGHVAEEARQLVEQRGLTAGVLARDVGGPVETLATAYVERARLELSARGRARILVGNGEPTIALPAPFVGAPAPRGRGGRATHLALLVARGIAGLPGVAFLAAGTDDRDGSADAAGAVVDGDTWSRALAAGLDPQHALTSYDSAELLGSLGALVRSRGTSNLLDVHLLGVASRP